MGNLLIAKNVGVGNVKLRIERLREQFHGYEVLDDELDIAAPMNDGIVEIDAIYDRYSTVAVEVTALKPPQFKPYSLHKTAKTVQVGQFSDQTGLSQWDYAFSGWLCYMPL